MSAEPVAIHFFRKAGEKVWIECSEGGDPRNVLRGDFEYRTLYTAPPAPVSAEPDQDFWDWLPLAYGDAGKGGQSCFTKFNMEVAFHAGRKNAPPSTNAKDSGLNKTELSEIADYCMPMSIKDEFMRRVNAAIMTKETVK